MRRLFFNVVPSGLVLNETVRHSFSLGVFLSFFLSLPFSEDPLGEIWVPVF